MAFSLFAQQAIANIDDFRSEGRTKDPTSKVLKELRQEERRRIPVDVALQASNEYNASGPVVVTLIVTNLFDKPLLMNRRMLVNHPRLQGEVSFHIVGPDGKRCELTRLVTPMDLREDDFITLKRGMSIQRSVDLADLYRLGKKGIYKVIAVYHNDIDQANRNLLVWKGVATSAPVEINLE